jgi:CHAD domain-containing protein
MDKKQINHITDKHFRKLKKHFKKVGPDFDPEAIHQFRVEYKKLRAFLRMLLNQSNAGKIKIPRKLKRMYKCAGAIRDLQLQEQRLLKALQQKNKNPKGCLRHLQTAIDKMKLLFAEIADEKIFAKAKRKACNALPAACSLAGLKVFAAKNWNEINTVISSKAINDKQIHSIRKNLKDLFFSLKIFKGAQIHILSLSKWNDKALKFMEELMLDLGSFQDNCTAVNLVKSYCPEVLKSNTNNVMKQLVEKWKLEKQRQKYHLIIKLKQAAAAL